MFLDVHTYRIRSRIDDLVHRLPQVVAQIITAETYEEAGHVLLSPASFKQVVKDLVYLVYDPFCTVRPDFSQEPWQVRALAWLQTIDRDDVLNGCVLVIVWELQCDGVRSENSLDRVWSGKSLAEMAVLFFWCVIIIFGRVVVVFGRVIRPWR